VFQTGNLLAGLTELACRNYLIIAFAGATILESIK
jgi:hypothetical protein